MVTGGHFGSTASGEQHSVGGAGREVQGSAARLDVRGQRPTLPCMIPPSANTVVAVR